MTSEINNRDGVQQEGSGWQSRPLPKIKSRCCILGGKKGWKEEEG